jgi:hypothetical protein
MSNFRVSLTLREAAACRIDYSAVRHYVETKLPSGLLDEWKEFILADSRSKKL